MTIEVLVGMIGAGKSTYARSRAKSGALVISHDALTEMLHAEYRYEEDLKLLYRQMEEALARLAVASGKDVVIDRTHLTRESRGRWIWFAKVTGVRVIAVTFPIRKPLTHAKRRFEHDPRGRTLCEWRFVAKHHYRQALASPILPSEGFDAILSNEEVTPCATSASR